MAESFTITGDIQAASMQQSIDWFGETFTITRNIIATYNPTTGQGTPSGESFTTIGIVDDRRQGNIGAGDTTIRGDEKAIIIGTKQTDGESLAFVPGISDLVQSGSINDTVAEVQIMQGPQGVVSFYRLVLKTA